jgi:transcriptional regulator
MYLPAHFEETAPEVLHGFIQEHPLATLIVAGANGLGADHIPMLLEQSSDAPVLRGHVARANPLWRALVTPTDVLVVFLDRGRYITPSWYPSKAESGRVVPTWNYAAVHVYGQARAIDDHAWLKLFLARLTDANETSRSDPWHLSDAPEAYIDAQLKAIVGIEVSVTRTIGKWKMSQNRHARDAQGVIAGLRSLGDGDAAHMADDIESRQTRR